MSDSNSNLPPENYYLILNFSPWSWHIFLLQNFGSHRKQDSVISEGELWRLLTCKHLSEFKTHQYPNVLLPWGWSSILSPALREHTLPSSLCSFSHHLTQSMSQAVQAPLSKSSEPTKSSCWASCPQGSRATATSQHGQHTRETDPAPLDISPHTPTPQAHPEVCVPQFH